MTRFYLSLCFLSLMFFPVLIQGWQSPWFCHDLDCPVYSSVNDTNDFETRVYHGGTFVRTSIMGRSLAVAELTGYNPLYNYMHGHNEANMKIPMTTPVITSVKPNLANNVYTIHFFLPYSLQKNPPTPLDSKVELIHYNNDFTVAVRSFEGYGLDLLDQLQQLQDTLDSNEVSYNPHKWFFAGYDKPTRINNRHNEVWLNLSSKHENYLHRIREWTTKAKEVKNKVEETIAETPLSSLLGVQLP